MKSEKQKRNYGIDLLRIVAMAFVVLLHQMLCSGGLNSTRADVFALYWLIEAAAICAVDVFAIISGYVSYRGDLRQRKISGIVDLWLSAVFYGLLIALAVKIFAPSNVNAMTFVKQFLPLSTDAHWYLTAYVGLFFLMPIVDVALINITGGQAKRTLIVILAVFSLANTMLGIDFRLSGGYGVLWLLIMYFTGGVMRKCDFGRERKSWKLWLGIVVAIFVGWGWRMLGATIAPLQIRPDSLLDYTAPTVVAISMMPVICFSRFRLSSRFEKIVAFCVPSVFAIYLINTNAFVWNYLLGWQAKYIESMPAIWLILSSFGFVVLFAVGAIMIDKIRIGFFKIVRLDRLEKLIDDRIKL